MKRWLGSVVATVVVLAWGGLGAAQIKMEIVGPGSTLSPIAVAGLKNLGGDDEQRLSARFVDTLRRDLELSGYFRVIDPRAYIEDPQTSGYDIGQFNFADWRAINADFVVKGAVSRKDGQAVVVAMLFDVAQQRRMMGKRLEGAPYEVRRMARRFADAVLAATTGVRGPFDTRLAFVSPDGARFKEIFTAPLDGYGLSRLTNNRTINLFPSFDRTGRRLVYLSYKSGHPALYLADLETQREREIPSRLGMTVGGVLTPDGRAVVASISRDGATNLYLLDFGGEVIRELTHNAAINVGPAVSADGKLVAFTSDRSGTPQIYLESLAGGRAQRLTYRGDYNTTPSFSPSADRVAYQSRVGGRFDIFAVSTQGGEPVRLTDGVGSNQWPAWSPDGRYLVFSSNRGGRPRLYLLLVSTHKVVSALMEERGDETSPAWSWWLR